MLLIFFFLTLLLFVDLHFMMVFGIFTSFLFIIGVNKLLTLEKSFDEIIKTLVFAMFLFNYLSFIENYLQMQPNDTKVLILSKDNSNVVLSNLDLSFEFSNRNFFVSNDFSEFYRKVYAYATLFTIKNQIKLNEFMKHYKIDSIVLTTEPFSEKSSIAVIKNAIWDEAVKKLINAIKESDGKEMNEKNALKLLTP